MPLPSADGSRQRWFGPEEPFATLIGAIDDATGTVSAALVRSTGRGGLHPNRSRWLSFCQRPVWGLELAGVGWHPSGWSAGNGG